MRDRNITLKSKMCPKCGKCGFRMGIGMFFIQQWCCYCTVCGYHTPLVLSEQQGCDPWIKADDCINKNKKES